MFVKTAAHSDPGLFLPTMSWLSALCGVNRFCTCNPLRPPFSRPALASIRSPLTLADGSGVLLSGVDGLQPGKDRVFWADVILSSLEPR